MGLMYVLLVGVFGNVENGCGFGVVVVEYFGE